MKVDLRLHTCYSYDSSAMPGYIAEQRIGIDLDCIAVTHQNPKEDLWNERRTPSRR